MLSWAKELCANSNRLFGEEFTLGDVAYRKAGVLGQGAFGQVMKVKGPQGQFFALKKILCRSESQLVLTKRQAQLMKELPECENIVRLISYSQGEDSALMLLQYCSGGSALQLLQNCAVVSDKVIRDLLLDVVTAVKVLHQMGYSHRDLKLQNVLLGEQGKWKLCDFGSCTSQEVDFGTADRSEYESLQEQIQKFITPMYRPPEVVDPYMGCKVGKPMDLWMLGCLLYTLCYRQHPFADGSKLGIVSVAVRYPGSRPVFQSMIRKLLVRKPQQRCSISELQADLLLM